MNSPALFITVICYCASKREMWVSAVRCLQRLVQADALPSSAPLVLDGAKYDRTMDSTYVERDKT